VTTVSPTSPSWFSTFGVGYLGLAGIVVGFIVGVVLLFSNPVRTETVHVQPSVESAQDLRELLGEGRPCEAPQEGVACAAYSDGKTYELQMVYVP
jgi:hypothetical protein